MNPYRGDTMARAARPTYILIAVSSLLAAVLLGAIFSRHTRKSHATIFLPAAFSAAVPQRVLWAWEEPEELQALPPNVGIAYLAETLLLGEHITILPRRQPLSPAPGSSLMAVVRIEIRSGFQDTPELRSELARRIGDLSSQLDVRALQIDFDATTSQQTFYAAMLQQLRAQLPRSIPLSITALVSWCGQNSWLHSLPVDEAVPMFFRMGGPKRMADQSHDRYQMSEPLCRTSIGLATDEGWPADIRSLNPATRIYFFAPQPWRETQLAAVAGSPVSSLAKELSR